MGPMQLPNYEEELARDEISPWYTLQHLKVEKRFTNKISAYLGVRNLFNFTQESPLVDPGAGSNTATNESWQETGFSPILILHMFTDLQEEEDTSLGKLEVVNHLF